MKNKLVLRREEFTSFQSVYLEYLWHKYFDIEYYDADKTYDPVGRVFVVSWQKADDDYSKQLKNQGLKVAVDNLWEHPLSGKDCHWIQHLDWCWFNESMWWRSMGYHRYQPNKTYAKLAFMPVRRQDHDRDKIVNALGARLDTFVWSYRDRTLPNDAPMTQDNYQRFFNPEWYDSTYFSVVVETILQGMAGYRWVSEKSFKPIAYKHPFIVIAQHGSLKKLRSLGFETYENLFDESYDDIYDFDQRLDAVIKNIDNFDIRAYDSITLGKLQHNHARFFDQDLVESKIVSEIIDPLVNYIET
jgi:hypothetical protein